MIPHSHKFPLRTEFLKFRAQAKKIVTPHVTHYLLPTTTPSRLAVVIPKKVNKLATTRNYLKRLVYDAIWPRVKDKSLDLVVVFKPLPLKKSPTTKTQIIRELSNLRV